MRKALIPILAISLLVLILLLSISVTAGTGSKWDGIIFQRYHKAFAVGSEWYEEWKVKLKEELGAELMNMKFEFTYISEEPDPKREEIINVLGTLKIHLICINLAEVKQTIHIERMVMIAIDKNKEVVLGGMVLFEGPIQIVDGWEGVGLET